MLGDTYVVVFQADKSPASQHERRYNTSTIDEVVIVLVGKEFESLDIFLHCEMVVFSKFLKLIVYMMH